MVTIVIKLVTLVAAILLTILALKVFGDDYIREEKGTLYCVGAMIGFFLWGILTALILHWPMVAVGIAVFVFLRVM